MSSELKHAVALLTAVGLFLTGRSAALAQSMTTLERDAHRIADCSLALDADCVVEFSHVESYEQLASPVDATFDFAEAQARLFEGMEQAGITYTSFEVSVPEQRIAGRGLDYAFVPYVAVREMDGRRLRTEAFFIAISEDDGTTWRFVDGQRLTAEEVRSIAPPYDGQPLPAARREGTYASDRNSHAASVAASEPSVVWQTESLATPPASFAQQNLAFSHDGRLVGVVREPNRIRFLDAEDGTLLPADNNPTHDMSAYSLAFARNDLLAIGRRGIVQIYNGRPSGAELVFSFFADAQRELTVGARGCGPGCMNIGALAFSPDGGLLAFQERRTAAAIARPGGVRVIDVQTRQLAVELDATSGRPHLAFSPNGNRLLAAHTTPAESGRVGAIRVWSRPDWNMTQDVILGGDGDLDAVATGRVRAAEFVAAYGSDGNVEMRDLTTGVVLWSEPMIASQSATRRGPTGGTTLSHLALSPDGELLVSYETPADDPHARTDGSIVVRDADEGAIEAVYKVSGVSDLAIAPDNETFVYAKGTRRTHIAMVSLREAAE